MTAILKVDTIQDTSGNNIINENANTITIGKSGDTTNIVGTLQNDGAAFAQGITEADMFRLTADKSGSSDVTANLERVDDASFAKIGTGMSESSGVFSFASTGLYQVTTFATFSSDGGGDNCKMKINVTTNNSSYDEVAVAVAGSSGQENTGSAAAFVNVTNVSNVKVKFSLDSMSGSSICAGNTDTSITSFQFIRLGDSQ